MTGCDAEPLCAATGLRMSRGGFLRALAGMKARVPIALLATAVAVTIAAGIFIDVRWAVVAIMLVTIVAPMTMAFLYIVWAISPRCLHNVYSHSAEIFPERMSITYLIPGIPAGDEEEEPEPRTVRVDVPAGDIAAFRVRMRDVVVTMRSPFGFIIFPYDKTSDPDALLKWLRRLNF